MLFLLTAQDTPLQVEYIVGRTERVVIPDVVLFLSLILFRKCFISVLIHQHSQERRLRCVVLRYCNYVKLLIGDITYLLSLVLQNCVVQNIVLRDVKINF